MKKHRAQLIFLGLFLALVFSLLFCLSDVSFQWQQLTLGEVVKQFIFFTIIFIVTIFVIPKGPKQKEE